MNATPDRRRVLALIAGGIAVAALPARGAAALLDESAPRIFASPTRVLNMPGVPRGQIRSLLNVRERMQFGDYVWNDAGVPGGRIWARVDRKAQIISVFRAGHEIGTAVILYGAPQKPTPAGRYPVLGKSVYHRSRLYDADMPFSLWITRDGIALHASNILEGRATHGCVGLPEGFARTLFAATRVGDSVIIV